MAQSGKTAFTKAKQDAEIAAAKVHKTSTQITGQSGITAATQALQDAEIAKANAALTSNQQ